MEPVNDGDGHDRTDPEVLLARANRAWRVVAEPSPTMAEVREHLDMALHHIRLAHLALAS